MSNNDRQNHWFGPDRPTDNGTVWLKPEGSCSRCGSVHPGGSGSERPTDSGTVFCLPSEASAPGEPDEDELEAEEVTDDEEKESAATVA